VRPCLLTLNVLSEHVVCVRYWAKFALLNKHLLRATSVTAAQTPEYSLLNMDHNRESEDHLCFWCGSLCISRKASWRSENRFFFHLEWKSVNWHHTHTHTLFLSYDTPTEHNGPVPFRENSSCTNRSDAVTWQNARYDVIQ